MSELDDAYKKLTTSQREALDRYFRSNPGASISRAACKLSLTRSFVHSYTRHLNDKENPS
jgi:hypothetical protein